MMVAVVVVLWLSLDDPSMLRLAVVSHCDGTRRFYLQI
jgi:hypothetical protein